MSAFISEQTQWLDSSGTPIVNGSIYIGVVNLDPKLNDTPIFSDRDLTVVLANPQLTDANGRSVNKIWIPGRYSLKIENSSGSQVFQELDNGEEAGISTTLLTNVQGINALTADASPAITSLTDKAQFIFEIVSENTTDAVTLAVGTTGAKAIKRNFDQDVGKGKFKANQTVIVIFNEGKDYYEWVNENARVIFQTKGADIAAAATVDLSLATGNFIDVTGDGGGSDISSFGTVLAGVPFSLRFTGTTPVTITSSSVANPTNILTATAHGITSLANVVISGHSGATPNINTDTDDDGRYVNTNVDTTNFTIPINVTVGGTGGTVYGIPTITDGANIVCPGNQDIELRANDIVDVVSLGAGVFFVEGIRRADGGPPIIASAAQVTAGVDNFLAVSSRRLDDKLESRVGSGGILQADIGAGEVGQGELKTTTGDLTTSSTVDTLFTGPGGEHGNWPTIKHATGSAGSTGVATIIESGTSITVGTSFLQRFMLTTPISAELFTLRQLYVQASPPYDMGDGDVHSFLFAIVDNISGLIESTYFAPDPPWANNGPTNISPDRIDLKTGKKYKTIKSLSADLTKLMNPDFITETEMEITANFKNSDMALIPHPFQGNNLTGKTIVLLDPMDAVVERLEVIKEAGGDPGEIIYGNYLNIGNTELGRGRPDGVMSVSVSMK